MAFQFSTDVRDDALDAMIARIGASPVLKIYDLTAGPPANCAASITGSILATLNLPSTFMNPASNGSATKTGNWEDAQADAPGTADFFRMFANDGTTCHIQGTVTQTGSGGDLTLDNAVIALNQDIIITAFTLNAGGA